MMGRGWGGGDNSSIMEGEKKGKKKEGDLRLNTAGAMETLMKYHPDRLLMKYYPDEITP